MDFVQTPTCQIPAVKSFTACGLRFYRPLPHSQCRNETTLISVVFDKHAHRYKLLINLPANRTTDIECCHRQILRSGAGNTADNRYRLLSCKKFRHNYIVPKYIDSTLVVCKSSVNLSVLQRDVFSFVQRRSVKQPPQKPPNMQKLSVIIFGIESLSHINFRRTMPHTNKYMLDNKWFQLQGYSKIGDKAYPNIVALLAGLNASQSAERCLDGLDSCPFLWHTFKRHGYHTAYAEDMLRFSIFKKWKNGFRLAPTEHYLRPMIMAMWEKLKFDSGVNDNSNCVGRQHLAEYVFDYAQQVAHFYEDEPFFGLFWSSSLTHDNFANPSNMDIRVLQYLQAYENDGIFQRTAFIFISDQGSSLGPLRVLESGFLEERLPVFAISLPAWFQAKHKEFVTAINVNKHRLTSPYDIHATLNHILELGNTSLKLPPPPGCPNSQSIFYEMPVNRTCADAGISEHWCGCHAFRKISSTSTLSYAIANLVVNAINEYLVTFNVSNSCLKLRLNSIDSVFIRGELPVNQEKATYRIVFRTEPMFAIFEATTIYLKTTSIIEIKLENISRLNTYEKLSRCIRNEEVRHICICRPKKKKKKHKRD